MGPAMGPEVLSAAPYALLRVTRGATSLCFLNFCKGVVLSTISSACARREVRGLLQVNSTQKNRAFVERSCCAMIFRGARGEIQGLSVKSSSTHLKAERQVQHSLALVCDSPPPTCQGRRGMSCLFFCLFAPCIGCCALVTRKYKPVVARCRFGWS